MGASNAVERLHDTMRALTNVGGAGGYTSESVTNIASGLVSQATSAAYDGNSGFQEFVNAVPVPQAVSVPPVGSLFSIPLGIVGMPGYGLADGNPNDGPSREVPGAVRATISWVAFLVYLLGIWGVTAGLIRSINTQPHSAQSPSVEGMGTGGDLLPVGAFIAVSLTVMAAVIPATLVTWIASHHASEYAALGTNPLSFWSAVTGVLYLVDSFIDVTHLLFLTMLYWVYSMSCTFVYVVACAAQRALMSLGG